MFRRKRVEDDMDAEDEDEEDPRELSDRTPLTRGRGRRASAPDTSLRPPGSQQRLASLQAPRPGGAPRRSLVLPSLEEDERIFFSLVDSGNVSKVEEFLYHHSGFNINCKNFQGTTALHKAVQSNSVQMVEALLKRGAYLGDCLLHAVRGNDPQTLESLLKQVDNPDLEQAGCIDSADFPDYMTPLMLAAQCGHYELIEMLLARGHRIEHPHPPDCFCDDVCQRDLEEDPLVRATSRLNHYRAIINPAYICLSSEDPILTAFQLCQELRQWASAVQEFRTEFTDLSKQVRAFAVELLDQELFPLLVTVRHAFYVRGHT